MTEIKQYYAQYFRYHFELDNDEVSQQELVSELGMHRKEVVVEFVCPHCRKCHTLRELYVTDKVQVTPEQWTTLGREALPRCRIARWRPPYTVYYKPVD